MTTEAEKIIIKKGIANPRESTRSLVKGNLFFFLMCFWEEYSQDKFQSNFHIPYICNELEEIARRVAKSEPNPYDLIINIPPGSTKTAIVSIMFPLWCWVNWYWMRFITASYTSPLALESAEYSRDIMRSDKWRFLFPELTIKQDKDMKSNFRVVKEEDGIMKRGGMRFSTSVGGSATGFHGHINIWDDPIDPLGSISEAEIKKANYWMDNVLPFRKTDKKVTATVGIMQRLGQNDPTGHLLKGKSKIRHICLPGEIRNYRDNVKPQSLIDQYTKDGLLDPNRLDWEVLKSLLDLGQYTYGGQVGQDPVPLGGGMFQVDHLSKIDNLPLDLNVAQTVRYWDKAATDGGGAWTVGVKMCKLKDGKFIVLDVKRGRWGSSERERIIRSTAEADGHGVSIAVEQEPGSGGKESAEATVRSLVGYSCHKDRPTGDKTFRADPYSVQVNDDRVMLMRAGWNDAYTDELENFPNSTYKDQVDASSGAFARLTAKRKVKVHTR